MVQNLIDNSIPQKTKCFNTPNNSSINIGSISFSHLLTRTNPNIYWDAMPQTLILLLILFYVLYVFQVEYAKPKKLF